MRVASVEKRARGKRLRAVLEDGAAVSLSPEIAALNGVREGAELSAQQRDSMMAEQHRQDAMAAALRLIACRPRSEKGLRTALRRRSFPADLVDATVARLRQLRLVDDVSFAAAWVESRDRMSPRGRRMLTCELQANGVRTNLAENAASSVDEADAAYRAAARRARSLAGCEFGQFREKLGAFLLRRGFEYEVAEEAVRRAWAERDGG
jgi:regulatory protein